VEDTSVMARLDCSSAGTLARIANLAHHRLGHHREVIAYLYGRGLTDEDIENWCIGYCDWSEPKTLLQDRVTLPIFGFSKSNVVAVSGRSLDGRTPKYWHTRFEKARWLYGLWAAEPGRRVCLVESQMDVIALSRLGVEALATMGSSLSPWQAALVRYFTDDAIVLPHADKPEEARVWTRILRSHGCRAVGAWGLYPPEAPDDADADWMVMHRPDLLSERLLRLEELIDGQSVARSLGDAVERQLSTGGDTNCYSIVRRGRRCERDSRSSSCWS